MAFIELADVSAATGRLARIYESAIKRAGRVFNILKLQSPNPPVLQALGVWFVKSPPSAPS